MAAKITFEVDMPPLLEPSPYISLADPRPDIRWLRGADDVVIPGRHAEVLIDYPCNPHVVHLRARRAGFTRGRLALAIAARYRAMYAEEDATAGTAGTFGAGDASDESDASDASDARTPRGDPPPPAGFNRPPTDGDWGIWGHGLGDLMLWAVEGPDEAGVYSLRVDS